MGGGGGGGVLTEIIASRSILCHISINIFCLNSISQTIRVREQQSQLAVTSVFYADVIVVKVVHVQHGALYSSQTISNGVASTEIRFGNLFT